MSPNHKLSDPARWVDEHGDYLFRSAMFRLRDRDAAEDVVQETLLAAMKNHGGFKGASSERTWLVGILRHKILDRFREANRQRPLYDDDTCENFHFNEQGHWQAEAAPVAWGTNPDDLVEQKEFWDVFSHGLSCLSAQSATAFILREVDGLETPKICEALNVSPENLWVMLHRARLSLRRFLQTNWFSAPQMPLPSTGFQSGGVDRRLPVPAAVSFASPQRLTA